MKSRINKWLAYDPLTMLDTYGENLASLRGVYFDVGNQDEFGINLHLEVFHQALTAANIAHEYQTYDGGHFNRMFERLAISLPFLSDAMVAEEEEENKAIVRRIYEEFLNQKNLDVVDELYPPTYVGHFPPNPDLLGPEGRKQFANAVHTGFPDVQVTIEDMIAEGDKVVVRSTTLGTHQGEFLGIPPTGNPVIVTGISIFRIAGGMVEEEWTNVDFLGLFQQLGIIPPTGSEQYTWGEPMEATGDPGTPEENKALDHRIFEEVFNQGNLAVVDEILSPDYLRHEPPNPDQVLGIEGYKQFVTVFLSGFPDLQITLEDQIAEGGVVVPRFTVRGTHTGELLGIPPTGNPVAFTGISIHRFADGRVVESWTKVDFLGMFQQLGVIPPPQPPEEEDFTNVFFTSLSEGLNMISLPLKPPTPLTARSFAEQLSSTVIIKYDETRRRFVGFTLDAPGDGFPIEGGKGYIVNLKEATDMTFVGAAWTNDPPTSVAPMADRHPRGSDNTWAFVVSGRIPGGATTHENTDGYLVTVRNTRTNAIATDVIRSGYFAAAFADLSRNSVVEAGDRLEVTVMEGTGEIASDLYSITVTPEIIRQAFLSITLTRVGKPNQSQLLQNYPNPFNPETWIPYQIQEAAPVAIKIYSAPGHLVRTLDIGQRAAGFYRSQTRAAYWDGKNDAGEPVVSGIYFYQLRTGDFSATRRMLILK